MTRREFIVLVAGAAAAWPFAVRAQRQTRIGFLPIGSASDAFDQTRVEAFRQGLRDVGLLENQHVTIDVIWVNDEPEISRAISELLQRGAKILVTVGVIASLEAKRQTSTIPILFLNVGNPIGIGLVKSLSRPEGNATGFSSVAFDLTGKFVEFATELGKPHAAINYLWYTGWPEGKNQFQATERAAQESRVELRSKGINDIAEVNDVIAAMKKDGAVTLIIEVSPFMYRHRKRLIDTAMYHGLATIFSWPVAATEGALIAYGPDSVDISRRAGPYIERILKGEKPADLPVQQPTKVDLVINLKTAKTLGITVPPSLLARADEVIE